MPATTKKQEGFSLFFLFLVSLSRFTGGRIRWSFALGFGRYRIDIAFRNLLLPLSRGGTSRKTGYK
jgi:hypothetical protein